MKKLFLLGLVIVFLFVIGSQHFDFVEKMVGSSVKLNDFYDSYETKTLEEEFTVYGKNKKVKERVVAMKARNSSSPPSSFQLPTSYYNIDFNKSGFIMGGNMTSVTQRTPRGPISPLASSIGVTTCGIINYDTTLLSDIQAERGSTCFKINASNIVLDGNGSIITGSGADVRIIVGIMLNRANLTNITIKNFVGINNFTYGIMMERMSNSVILNNTIESADVINGYGIYLQRESNFNNISLNYVTTIGPSAHGIRLVYSKNNYFSSNKISTSGSNAPGIYVEHAAHNNTLYLNSINMSSSGTTGIVISKSNYNTALSNTITLFGASGDAIQLTYANDSIITLNNINTFSHGANGITVLIDSNRNLVSSNIINTFNSASAGIVIVSDVNTILSNDILTNGGNSYGIALNRDAENNLLLNNNVLASQADEIMDLSRSTYLNYFIYNNTYGQLDWVNGFLENLDINVNNNQGIGLGKNLFIGENIVALNTSAFDYGGINSSAEITLRNLGFATVNEIRKLNAYSTDSSEIISSGLDCLGTTCQIISYDNTTGMLVFNTTSLGSFAAVG